MGTKFNGVGVLLLGFLLLGSNAQRLAFGQVAPALEFKQFAIGMKFEDMPATKGIICPPSLQTHPRIKRCIGVAGSYRDSYKDTIAGAPIESIHFFFLDGRLARLSISFASGSAEAIAEALREKFGAFVVRSESIQTRAGVTYENLIWEWRRPDGRLKAEKYSGTIDKGLLAMTSNEYLEFSVEELRQRGARGAKDL